MTSRLSPMQIRKSALLTERETEVLRLLGDGKTTNEIAAELKIAVKTVQDFHQKSKRKLRAETMHQLIYIAKAPKRSVAPPGHTFSIRQRGKKVILSSSTILRR